MKAEPLGLTKLQRDTFLVIQEMLKDGDGVAPSVREIGNEIERSPSAVHGILVSLRERGWISWLPGRNRSIHLLRSLPAPDEFDDRPFVGFFNPAAGPLG